MPLTSPAGDKNPATGEVVLYPYQCPHCINGEWEDGEPCSRCEGRGVVDDVSEVPPDRRQLAPRPPAVMQEDCTDCRYQPGRCDVDDADMPFWCHQGMPVGARGGLSPVAWAAGMPLGYRVCSRWWTTAIEAATAEAALEP